MIKKNIFKRTINLILQVLIVMACLFYVFSDINSSILLNRLQAINTTLILPAILLVLLGYLFLAFRLLVLVKNYSLHSFVTSLNASIIALGVNNIFPLKLGEIAKALYLNKKMKIMLSHSFSLVIWERFADINFLALLGLVALAFYQPAINLQPLFIVVVILWLGLFIYLKVDYIYYRLTFFLPTAIQKILRQLHSALIEKRSINNVLGISILTLFVWLFYILQLWFILEKLLLIHLSIPQLLTVFVVTALGVAVPSVPGAIGVYEAAMVLSLGWFGIDKTEALMAGIVCHSFILIPCTLISLLLLSNMSTSLITFKNLLIKAKSQEEGK